VRTKTVSHADKILQAAAQLFGSQRFHEVRMDDIADLAEVGKGTLYRYYKDKDELYLGVLRWESEQYLARIRQVLDEAMTATHQLIALVGAIIEYFDEHPHLFALIQRAEVSLPPEQAFPWQQTRMDTVGLVLELLRTGEANGEFQTSDAELATLLLLGGLRSIIRFGKTPRDPDLYEKIVHGFLEGIRHYA
jgi:TetR/AcrR family fatty acid metabolism transcriptional regulator